MHTSTISTHSVHKYSIYSIYGFFLSVVLSYFHILCVNVENYIILFIAIYFAPDLIRTWQRNREKQEMWGEKKKKNENRKIKAIFNSAKRHLSFFIRNHHLFPHYSSHNWILYSVYVYSQYTILIVIAL